MPIIVELYLSIDYGTLRYCDNHNALARSQRRTVAVGHRRKSEQGRNETGTLIFACGHWGDMRPYDAGVHRGKHGRQCNLAISHNGILGGRVLHHDAKIWQREKKNAG